MLPAREVIEPKLAMQIIPKHWADSLPEPAPPPPPAPAPASGGDGGGGGGSGGGGSGGGGGGSGGGGGGSGGGGGGGDGGGDDPAEDDDLYRRGLAHKMRGEHEPALDLFERALVQREQRLGKDTRHIAQVTTFMLYHT